MVQGLVSALVGLAELEALPWWFPIVKSAPPGLERDRLLKPVDFGKVALGVGLERAHPVHRVPEKAPLSPKWYSLRRSLKAYHSIDQSDLLPPWFVLQSRPQSLFWFLYHRQLTPVQR